MLPDMCDKFTEDSVQVGSIFRGVYSGALYFLLPDLYMFLIQK